MWNKLLEQSERLFSLIVSLMVISGAVFAVVSHLYKGGASMGAIMTYGGWIASVLLALWIIHLTRERSCVLEKDCEPESKHCFVGKRLAGEKDAKASFVLEIRKFQKLVDESNAENNSTANKTGDIEVVRAREYIERAKSSRGGSAREIHVLFATRQAIIDFYSQYLPDWIKSEPAKVSDVERRRIMVVGRNILNGTQGDIQTLKNLALLCDKTSDLKLMDEDEAMKHYPHILRDYGVFFSKVGTKNGFFSYVPYPRTDVFGQFPGKYYIVHNRKYLDRIWAQFDGVWSSAQIEKSNMEMRGKLDLNPQGQPHGKINE